VLAGLLVSLGTRATESAPFEMVIVRLLPSTGMFVGEVMFGPWMITLPLNGVPVTLL